MEPAVVLRVSEVYPSTQGEGPNVGKTTVFVRFGGCNLRCPGWPCDTQHAIDPKYRNEWTKMSPESLEQDILTAAKQSGARNVTLTGGEPFLQPKEDLHWLTRELKAMDYSVDCFSNGTIAYPEWACDMINFIMDWKLPGSGENAANQIRLDNIERLDYGIQEQAVKFVIKDKLDFDVAKGLWKAYIEPKHGFETFYGRVWGVKLTDAELVAWIMAERLPWRLNRQEHNYIWPPNERGR
jgi:7-carboxy-7-deazaguanine synthase